MPSSSPSSPGMSQQFSAGHYATTKARPLRLSSNLIQSSLAGPHTCTRNKKSMGAQNHPTTPLRDTIPLSSRAALDVSATATISRPRSRCIRTALKHIHKSATSLHVNIPAEQRKGTILTSPKSMLKHLLSTPQRLSSPQCVYAGAEVGLSASVTAPAVFNEKMGTSVSTATTNDPFRGPFRPLPSVPIAIPLPAPEKKGLDYGCYDDYADGRNVFCGTPNRRTRPTLACLRDVESDDDDDDQLIRPSPVSLFHFDNDF